MFAALRYGNVYGPRQNPCSEAGVVAIFSSKLLKKEQPVIFGDGKQTRDFVYVDDVVNATIIMMENAIEGIFNVGTGKETSVNEIFDCIKKTAALDGSNKIYKEAKKGEVKRSCLSPAKIYGLTGWHPKVGIEEGIKRTLSWFSKRLFPTQTR